MMERSASPDAQAVADAAMDAKMRQLWARLEKPWVRRILREHLPPTRVRALDCDFIVHPHDNFTEFRMWENGLPPEHEATRELADRFAGQDAVIVDVGANVGAFSLPILRAAGPGARALAFEPNPLMRERLARNAGLNGLDRLEIVPNAVGASVGAAEMHFPRNGNQGQGRIEIAYGADEAGFDVEVRPLADCLAERHVPRVDLLKVDVEGLEDQVICPLLDGNDALWPRLLYFESEHEEVWRLPLLDRLAACGYSLSRSYGKNQLFERSA